MPELTAAQREVLLRPIKPSRVLHSQGQSHLPAYDVEAHLTRIFGYEGWDREIVELWLIAEAFEPYINSKNEQKEGWTVTYGCRLRLTVRNPAGEVVKITDGCATGSANHLPLRGDAHDFAMKNADSYALKRCAKALGDQFGLSLYNKGATGALVKSVIAYGEAEPTEYEAPQTLGNDEREQDPIPPNGESFETPGATASAVYVGNSHGGSGGSVARSDDDPPPRDEDGPPANTMNPGTAAKASPAQVGMIQGQFRELGLTDREAKHGYVARIVGHKVDTLVNLTKQEASAVIQAQQEDKATDGTGGKGEGA